MAEGMRISDRERDAAVSKLRDFHAEGRLSVEEFEERISAALTAKTASDLSVLFKDLPGGAVNVSNYGPEREYPVAPYQPVAAPYPQPQPTYYTPVAYQPMPRKPKVERPWYAQWWLLIIPVVLVTGFKGLGFLIPLFVLWLLVIYPSIARSRAGAAPLTGGQAALRKLSYHERDQVMREIIAGRKNGAIKLYRDMTGSDRITAKRTVEAWSRGLPS